MYLCLLLCRTGAHTAFLETFFTWTRSGGRRFWEARTLPNENASK